MSLASKVRARNLALSDTPNPPQGMRHGAGHKTQVMTAFDLENVNLKRLLAPVTEELFYASHWERVPLIVNRQDPGAYGDLFTLSDFDRAVCSKANSVRVAGGKEQDVLKYGPEILSTSLERILHDMRGGATLILDSLNLHEPKLDLLCRRMEEQLSHRFRADVFLSGPNNQAFIPHFDKNDFFVLQVFGSKQWRVERARREMPESTLGFGPQNLELAAEPDRFTLHQGDLAYIPRGFVHTAHTGSEPSLHLTLAMAPFLYADLLRFFVDRAIAEDESLRAALPLGFLKNGSDALWKKAADVFATIAREGYLRDVTESFKDELVAKFPVDPSGQIEGFYRNKPLELDYRVGPRPGLVWRLRADAQDVTLRYGTRKIVFPAFLKEPLEFALNRACYLIRELPGDLEPSEKIVFVERLLEEGLVVHKPR